MKWFSISTWVVLYFVASISKCYAQHEILHDKYKKTILIVGHNRQLKLRLNYSNGCVIDQLVVNGAEVTGNGNVVYSGVRIGNQSFTSEQSGAVLLKIINNAVHVPNVKYGDSVLSINETWRFIVQGNDIAWKIDRKYNKEATIEENFFPCWQFNSIKTWDGALLDNGGVAWNFFLNNPGDTYGSAASDLVFWNKEVNSGLRVLAGQTTDVFRTATFSHTNNKMITVVQSSATRPIETRMGLRRFLQTGEAVFAPIKITGEGISVEYSLQPFTYNVDYDRGDLKGIKEASINEMLNTIGRYGVVDENIYGSNGWRTGFAVLQEPWLALFGIAINAPDFINGYTKTLEYQKLEAILPNGRILPRWHHDSTDAMPGTFMRNGFYECQWGYMLDAQPAFAINVAEQFDLTGDLEWLRQFKSTCEKVLAYMIERDADGDGLFEVVQNSYREKRGTDWLDVIWASYEVASINAYMYKALIRWSELEVLLGDNKMAQIYQGLAVKLKTTFNKDIKRGGFWNPEENWYVHWREKDNSVYGNNFVAMVNFLAIGYGLCDDTHRKEAVLNKMEKLMQKENLFVWPSCFYPYEDSVGLSNINYPYPNYENGDLFLAWAELGTRCYAEKDPAVALKYIKNVIAQYEKDGLAHQRYTRGKQMGVGDDILSNNIMAIVGLYRNIYGIRPSYNRLYLEPHLTPELNGTKLKYWLRGEYYNIGLSEDHYTIGVNQYSVANKNSFGINYHREELQIFKGNEVRSSLTVKSKKECTINITSWSENEMIWTEKAGGTTWHEVSSLKANTAYALFINGAFIKKFSVGGTELIRFDCAAGQSRIKLKKVVSRVN